jgi:hypothetical protein
LAAGFDLPLMDHTDPQQRRNNMDTATAEKHIQVILNVVNNHVDMEDVRVSRSYSGRGMFGKECIGVTGSDADLHEFHILYAHDCKEAGLERVKGWSRDNMGFDVISYAPSIPDPWKPEHDEDE